jgi:hypothetical protein
VNRPVSVGWLIAESIPREPPPDERRAIRHQSRVELGGSSSVVVLAVGVEVPRVRRYVAGRARLRGVQGYLGTLRGSVGSARVGFQRRDEEAAWDLSQVIGGCMKL